MQQSRGPGCTGVKKEITEGLPMERAEEGEREGWLWARSPDSNRATHDVLGLPDGRQRVLTGPVWTQSERPPS